MSNNEDANPKTNRQPSDDNEPVHIPMNEERNSFDMSTGKQLSSQPAPESEPSTRTESQVIETEYDIDWDPVQ